MAKLFGTTVSASFAATVIYSIASLILFIVVCVYGWKVMKARESQTESSNQHKCQRYVSWVKLVWKMKSIYLSALVHIYDIGTDVGIIVEWGVLMWKEHKGKEDIRDINMMGLFVSSVVAFFMYRFISAAFVFEFTGKFGRAAFQFLDLEIYHAIYITHKLGRDEAGNLQRWLQKFEAIFESAPQSLLQMVYIVKTADYSLLIVSSIVLSFFSVAARFTSDDKIFFNENAEQLGLKWVKRKKTPKKEEKGFEKVDEISPETDTFKFDGIYSESHILKSEPDLLPQNTRTNEVTVGDDADTEKLRSEDDKLDIDEIVDDVLFAWWKFWNHIGFNRAYLFRYGFRMCDVFSRLMILALIWVTLSGVATFFIIAFEMVTFVVYATSIGKYNFFQFLVATYFSEDNRKQTVTYCFFRRMESLLYLIGVSVVILFHDKYNEDVTIDCYKNYCMESEWDTYYSNATPWPGYAQCLEMEPNDSTYYSLSVEICMGNAEMETCDCRLAEEVVTTKMLLIFAWAFASLSGSVFFGAFNSMRDKFGTNERNIVNVLQKRDWEAFSEMLQFGYRMNRFDKRSQRSALAIFLDRVPSDKFDVTEVNIMIRLGANINDVSIKPTNEFDELDPQKNGDNVLIRYIKVTQCDTIDKEFDEVVKQWSKTGVIGGEYRQDLERIALDINAENAMHYTAFKIYWEKMQYERRRAQQKREYIKYKRECVKIQKEFLLSNDDSKFDEAQFSEDEMHEMNALKDEQERNENWFANFYNNILKWADLGADMGTLSEDRVSPLLAYIQDTDIDTISMETVRLLCPTDKIAFTPTNTKVSENEEQKYELKSVKIDTEEAKNRKHLDKEIKMKAFSTWIEKYDTKEQLFAVKDIEIWHELGCTDEIKQLQLIGLYLQRCDLQKQDHKDIETLLKCGCGLENDHRSQFISMKPLPMTNVIDHMDSSKVAYPPGLTKVEKYDRTVARWCKQEGIDDYVDDNGDGKFIQWVKRGWGGGEQAVSCAEDYFSERSHPKEFYTSYVSGQSEDTIYPILEECWENFQAFHNGRVAPINMDMLEYLEGTYQLNRVISDVEVYDINNNSYHTRFQKIIQTDPNLSVDLCKRLLNIGYKLVFDGAKPQQCLHSAIRNSKLPFDVFQFLLDAVIERLHKTEMKEYSGDDAKLEMELDYQIFNKWIAKNEYIQIEEIETLIKKYGFSPFKSDAEDSCSIFDIWTNANIEIEVMYRYWKAYGEQKFAKYEGLYQGFLMVVLEHKELDLDQMKYLEQIFKEYLSSTDEKHQNNIIHVYCKNTKMNFEVLKYLCEKYKDLLDETNKKDHHALHLLCQNNALKMEYLIYFVQELKVPMNIKTHAGWQPFQALHYLVDNEAVKWKRKDVGIMLDTLNVDFMTRRSGEYILFRLSKMNNFTTEALILLYRRMNSIFENEYREKLESDPNAKRTDLNDMKTKRQEIYWGRNAGGTGILANLVKRKTPITPKQIERLVKRIKLDITAKDNDNKSVLHYAATKRLTASVLKKIGDLMKKALERKNDKFVVDMPDKSGATPFQLWISAVKTKVVNHTDIVKVWEYLGADITQSENGSSFNMLHHYLKSSFWQIKLSYIRKMCFDDENPWKKQEKQTSNAAAEDADKKRVIGKYQIPLHIKPIPNNVTLANMYTTNAVKSNATVNINLFQYFLGKKENIRFDLESSNSVLWIYLQDKHLNLDVIKYLINELKCKIEPQPQDNIAFRYMEFQNKRDKIDWEILDYFHDHLEVDFKFTQGDYDTILHVYARKVKTFDCDEFRQLINRYDLKSILMEKGSTDPTASGVFYETRRAEIRPDIIQLFTELGYDINEPVGNVTPIQYYCDLSPNHYIIPSIVESFIKDGGAQLNKYIGKKDTQTVAQLIANSDAKVAYKKFKTLQMMIQQFGIKLTDPRKRKQDICYNFIQRYHENRYTFGDFFERFLELMRIYINADNHKPIHLFHDDEEDGKDKRIKYKLYRVKDVTYEREISLKKNKKTIKTSKKYINRIIYVTDARDAVFRYCKVIDPRSAVDWEAKRLPEKWLMPITWKEFSSEIDGLEKRHSDFQKSATLATANYFIDMETINTIKELHSENKEMINDITLPKAQNILIKYLNSNHSSQLSAADIDMLKSLGVDFKFGYNISMDALRSYCGFTKNKGLIDKSIVQALIRGGCPINWEYEEPEEDDEKKGDDKGEVIKNNYTPLQYYCKLEEANIDAFRSLIQCKADVKIESAQNFSSIYYLLKHSKHITADFVKFIAKDCGFNFNTPLQTSSGWNNDTILFNMYLRENKKIYKDAIRAFIEIGDVDANSTDDINDTNSIKAYIENKKTENFDCDTIRVLVDLGANINEPDNEGVYPIQHLLRISWTPLIGDKSVITYIKHLLELGAKLEHILCDDSAVMQDYKLYKLQDMKDGYEHYNGCWCTIDAWIWEGNGKKNKVQSAVVLDETGSNQKLCINIRRSNLIDITKKELLEKYPQLKSAKNVRSDEDIFSDDEEEEDDIGYIDGDDNKEEEQPQKSDDNISMQMAKLVDS